MDLSEYIVILVISILCFYIFIKNIIGSKIVIAKCFRSYISSSSISLFDSGPQYRIYVWKVKLEDGTTKHLEYGFFGFKGMKKILLYNAKKNKLISIFKVILFLSFYVLTLFYLVDKIYLFILSIVLSFFIFLFEYNKSK